MQTRTTERRRPGVGPMHRRWGALRQRGMARRTGRGGGLSLSPRDRRLAGWLAAIGVIGLIALSVRILGGNADGTSVLPDADASPTASPPLAIAFGTALDGDRRVAPGTARTRFADGDTFAYSVDTGAPPPAVVYVEVERTDAETPSVVQTIAEGEQQVPERSTVIGFSVPAANLQAAFGPGRYEMRIHLDPDGDPVAVGAFELVDPIASPPPGG